MTDKILLADGVEFVPGMVVYTSRSDETPTPIQTDSDAHHVCGGWLRLLKDVGLFHHACLFSTHNGVLSRAIGHIDRRLHELTEKRSKLEAMLQ